MRVNGLLVQKTIYGAYLESRSLCRSKKQPKTKTPPGAVIYKTNRLDLSVLIVIGVGVAPSFNSKRIRDRSGTVKHDFFRAKGRQ
jgi:hypothetical protein